VILPDFSYDKSLISLPSNIGEQLIEKGLATALRHRKDDENRSPDYDKFIIAEKA
jgi:staphylococcal nuclease domain-containing protein 1